MATEAQRLIGISLAKIAQSRCGRGGVSLHKNLLVATVLQKARFIFMEEAYHMVHGHYLQANKFLEPDIDIQDDPVQNDDNIDESELDDIFDSPASSIGKDTDSADFAEEICENNKENSPPTTEATPNVNNSNLVYLDLDKHIQKASQEQAAATTNDTTNSNNTNNNNKRRREISEWETEEAVLSILPKKIKSDVTTEQTTTSIDDIFLSDREDDNTAAINLSVNVSRELELDELNNNVNNNNNNLVSNNNVNNSTQPSTNNLENGPSMEGIDRITSLVSIFSFGNLTRSVSTPDLCSAQATKDSCSTESSISQRTYLAMTV
ncbi:probable serine/threonine-protein kinase fhkE [Culicoides brevitarsis]|uniref:probable serine/threonine-protein kinase fhkE n=1 Tax=Culicoides brevitarsis TaxID=469753 RepID=UPI00307BA7FF